MESGASRTRMAHLIDLFGVRMMSAQVARTFGAGYTDGDLETAAGVALASPSNEVIVVLASERSPVQPLIAYRSAENWQSD